MSDAGADPEGEIGAIGH